LDFIQVRRAGCKLVSDLILLGMTSSSSWMVDGQGGAAIATAIAGGDREAMLKEVAKPHCRYGF